MHKTEAVRAKTVSLAIRCGREDEYLWKDESGNCGLASEDLQIYSGS
jgi:hypothetical protein